VLNEFCEYLNRNAELDGVDLPGYINLHDPPIEPVKLEVGNIATYDAGQNANNANLLMSVIRIEEESILKNFPNQKIIDDKYVDKRYPKIHLNYYILFTATLPYHMAIGAIHRVIKFFQTNNTHTFDSDGNQITLVLELFSPTFEQLNQIWSTLGGKQYPHVIYKVRLSELEYNIEKPQTIITSIEGTISEK